MSFPLPGGTRKPNAGWTYSSGAKHAAFDYRTGIGTPVFAVTKGVILKVVDHIPNLSPKVDGESGDPPNYIIQGTMFQGVKVSVIYMHISPTALVKEGDRVEDGQQIAKSGHNGHSTGPHLHICVVKGWGNLNNPFHYLHGLVDNMAVPTGGMASNGITIFPPSQLFTRTAARELPANQILMADMVAGATGSESVRRLQARLNTINLPDSVQLTVNGNYNKQTQTEVQRWQMAKFKRPKTAPSTDGILRKAQVPLLFGAKVGGA